MHTDAPAEIDIRAGASWLASAGLAERLQLLGGLLSRFNHDVRTPLNTITGWGHLLQQPSVEPARSRHGADVIARSARDTALMLDAFVEDARIILGHRPLEAATARLDEVIAEVVAQASGAEKSRNALQVRIDAGGAAIDGDGRLLQRLISRLAVVIARRAHEGATVDLGVAREDGTICVSLAAPKSDADWSEADLLELRISTLEAAALSGALELHAGLGTAALTLRLPEAARVR